jgi:hypothetical protein
MEQHDVISGQKRRVGFMKLMDSLGVLSFDPQPKTHARPDNTSPLGSLLGCQYYPLSIFLVDPNYSEEAMGAPSIWIAWLKVMGYFAWSLHGSLEVGDLNSETHTEKSGFLRPSSLKFFIEPLTIPNINNGTCPLLMRLETRQILHNVLEGPSSELIPLHVMKFISIRTSPDDDCGYLFDLGGIGWRSTGDFDVTNLDYFRCQQHWF